MNISCMEIHIKKSSARWRPFVQVFQCITHWGQVTHTRISKLEHIWFRYWLVAWSAPSHCLNQCWNIVNWTLGNTQMHLKMSPAKSRPSLLDLSALTAAVATDSFDPVVHYVKVTHWPSDNVFTHPLVPECPKKYQITFHRKQLAFYVAYSDKTINLNLFLHHEPNGSTKGKLSNRNQETNICLYLYPGTCTQVHVWLNVLLFIPLLYYMLHFCCFFCFAM